MEILFFILDYIKLKVEFSYFLTLLIFFVVLFFYNMFCIPGNLIFVASSGFFFGVYIGFIISIFSLVLGSLVFFSFFSLSLKKIFSKSIKKYSLKFDKYFINTSLEYLIIFRMIPGPPLLFQNLFLSTLNINKFKFFVSTFIGFTPLIFIFTFIGDKINDFENLKSLSINDAFSFKFIILFIFIIIFLVIRILYKKKNL